MIAALAGPVGMLLSFAQPLFGWLQKRQELQEQAQRNQQELAMMDKVSAQQAQAQGAKLEEVRIQGMIAAQIAAMKPGADPKTTMEPPPQVAGTSKWVSFVNGWDMLLTVHMNAFISSVRPVVTYINNIGFWGLIFIDVDVSLALGLIQRTTGVAINVEAWKLLLASELIQAVIATYASINGFWFGTRMIQKMGLNGR